MSFDQVLINGCAPALCGIKSASMFSMSSDVYGNGSERIGELKEYFAKQGIYIVPIQKKNGRMLFFVYNKKLLKKVCNSDFAKKYLASKGYPVLKDFESILSELLFRLISNEEFPHEVGFFLGYPLEDVIKFERYSGANFKYSGYWKVYGNVDSAISTMKMYKDCSSYCMNMLSKGLSVPLVACNYKQTRALVS